MKLNVQRLVCFVCFVIFLIFSVQICPVSADTTSNKTAKRSQQIQKKEERKQKSVAKKAQAAEAQAAAQKKRTEHSLQKELLNAQKIQQKEERLKQRKESAAQAKKAVEDKRIQERKEQEQRKAQQLQLKAENLRRKNEQLSQHQETAAKLKQDAVTKKEAHNRQSLLIKEQAIQDKKIASSDNLKRFPSPLGNLYNFLKGKKARNRQKQTSSATINVMSSRPNVSSKSRTRQELKKIREKVQPIYAEAVKFYRKGFLEKSKYKFRELQKIDENYLNTKEYLSRIDNIQTKKIDEERTKKREDLERQYRSEKLDKKMQKSIQDMQINLAKTQEDRRMSEHSHDLYSEAVELYKIQDYRSAKVKFLQIREMYTNYKATQEYLGGIDDLIEKQEKELEDTKRDPVLERLDALDPLP